MRCPVCDYSQTARLFFKNNYWINECHRCHHQFAAIAASLDLVEQVYRDSYFQNGGAGYPDYVGEKDILINHGRRYARLLTKYIEPGELLDVGAAAGFILKGFSDSGWSGMGIEPNATMVAYGRNNLGLNLQTAALENFQCDHRFDVISMIQVVAHFFDLHQAIEQARKLTKPNGLILIETWNRDSWLAKLLKSKWHEYNPPSVLHFFSAAGLDQLMIQHGFAKLAAGRPAKRLSGKHAKSILCSNFNKSTIGGLAQRVLRLIPDRLTLPYPAVDLFWAIFKKL